MFVSLWLIFHMDMEPFSFPDIYTNKVMSYILLMLIPYPFLFYMDI